MLDGSTLCSRGVTKQGTLRDPPSAPLLPVRRYLETDCRHAIEEGFVLAMAVSTASYTTRG